MIWRKGFSSAEPLPELAASALVRGPDDERVASAVARGDRELIGLLWARHAARARGLVAGVVAADQTGDVVAEAIARALRDLTHDVGATAATFETRLDDLLGEVAAEYAVLGAAGPDRRRHPLPLSGPTARIRSANVVGDPVLAGWRSLPASDRQVLWRSEILLGGLFDGGDTVTVSRSDRVRLAYLTAGSRDRMRRTVAYAYAAVATSTACRRRRRDLPGHVRGSLTRQRSAALHSHLSGCAECREAAVDIAFVGRTLRGAVGLRTSRLAPVRTAGLRAASATSSGAAAVALAVVRTTRTAAAPTATSVGPASPSPAPTTPVQPASPSPGPTAPRVQPGSPTPAPAIPAVVRTSRPPAATPRAGSSSAGSSSDRSSSAGSSKTAEPADGPTAGAASVTAARRHAPAVLAAVAVIAVVAATVAAGRQVGRADTDNRADPSAEVIGSPGQPDPSVAPGLTSGALAPVIDASDLPGLPTPEDQSGSSTLADGSPTTAGSGPILGPPAGATEFPTQPEVKPGPPIKPNPNPIPAPDPEPGPDPDPEPGPVPVPVPDPAPIVESLRSFEVTTSADGGNGTVVISVTAGWTISAATAGDSSTPSGLGTDAVVFATTTAGIYTYGISARPTEAAATGFVTLRYTDPATVEPVTQTYTLG